MYKVLLKMLRAVKTDNDYMTKEIWYRKLGASKRHKIQSHDIITYKNFFQDLVILQKCWIQEGSHTY